MNINEIKQWAESYAEGDFKAWCKSRKRKYVETRNAIFYVLRENTNLNLTKIGNIFGITHGTVIHGLNLAEDAMSGVSSLKTLSCKISSIEEDFQTFQRNTDSPIIITDKNIFLSSRAFYH